MKIAIMGFGVVGGGVGDIITKSADSLAHKSGEPIEVKYILDLRDFPDSEFRCFTKEFSDILGDPEIGIVVEVMGGVNPAYSFTKQLLKNGKHVVTSNKELVARHGTELLAIAEENNVNYMFEASVGGGIPIIRPLHSCLAANMITEVAGILNGTTNYILTQMIKNGKSFEDALSGAQENGYAEKDPTADVEGHDTCRKIAILASLAFGKWLDSNAISTEGITKITIEDVKYADKLGFVIKLIGYARREGDKAWAIVAPMLLAKDHPLAGIDDVFNGIMVKGDSIGDVMFYGRGAGKLPTASAVIADVIDIIKHKDKNIHITWTDSPEGYILNEDTKPVRYYVRFKGKDACSYAVNLGIEGEYAIITSEMTPNELDKYIAGMTESQIITVLRLMEE